MYSDIRRDSDLAKMAEAEMQNNRKNSMENNKMNNCNQIFTKGLTKDFLEKMHHDIGAKKSYILGDRFNTRQIWLFAGLLLLFVLSFFGSLIMWFTGLFDTIVYDHLVIRNGSQTYEQWAHVLPKPLMKVYLFNYTNIDKFKDREDEKLNVQELGPYVYEYHLDRINVEFDESGELASYRNKHTYKFRPDLSKGRQNDIVNIPNIPLLAGASNFYHRNIFERLAFNSFLNGLAEQTFVKKGAHRLITGYENDFYDFSKSFLKLRNEKPAENFGILSGKYGIQPDIFTINTGASDINKLNMLEQVNGKESNSYWSTDECNSFRGTDGSMFPPRQVREKRPLRVYLKEMCRTLPFNFDHKVTILDGKIPAYRYKLPLDFLDTPDEKPENQCFCDMDSGACPPKGVFNATPCNMGAPIFFSLPHLYNADESLRKQITGLKDLKPEEVQSYSDYHPTMGFSIAGKMRLQLNVQVKKSFGVSTTDMFEDGMILPTSWFEMHLDDRTLPEDFISIIYQTTFTIRGVELGLKYGCLLVAIVTAICLFIVLKSKFYNRERTSSIRPLKGTNSNLIEP